MKNQTNNEPRAAGEAAHTLKLVSATRNNAGIYVAQVFDGYHQFATVTGLTALEAEQKAVRIVRACNSHAALVALAETVSRRHPGPGGIGDLARAALQLAKEGQQ